MTPSAIVMMVIALLTVWGGLIAASIHLRANPDETSGDLGLEEDLSQDL